MFPNNEELEMYEKVYDYTQYSHDNHVNVIPEASFKKLVHDTFHTITDTLRGTYGPYGSTMMISDQSQTTTTKDGYNVFEAMGFSHHYKRMVYLAIKKICERVNRNVGDGTTSCILLAEKIFNNLNEMVKTPDEKRHVLDILDKIETDLQKMELINQKEVKPLNMDAMKGLINLASNYDESLTKTLIKAFNPVVDKETQIIQSVRNVIPEADVDYSISPDSSTMYAIEYMPGQYRVRVNMDVEFALSMVNPTKVRLILYDHAFNETDWLNFIEGYDDTKTIILARTFMKSFMDSSWLRYLKQKALSKQPVNIILAELKGSDIQNEFKDLAAVLKTDIHTLVTASPIDHATLPEHTITIYKNNCLCLMDLTKKDIPTQYIEMLELEMKKELSKSLVKHQAYMDRLIALRMLTKDTLITVRGSSSLEVKMIMDKIDDCTSIVRSALEYGIVPNLLVYGYKRLGWKQKDDKLTRKIKQAIKDSIVGLFEDIMKSKYGETYKPEMLEKYTKGENSIYKRFTSFDVINEMACPVENLPTSTQYDLEVIAASISIVKYLLTSRALIFDAHLMTPQGDQGHYKI